MPESRWERARHSPHVPPGPNASSWNDTTTGHHVDPYALTEGSSTYEGDTGRSTPPGGGRRTRRDPGTEPGHLAASYDHLSAYPGAPFDSHPGAPFDAHPGGPSDSYRGGPADSYRGSPSDAYRGSPSDSYGRAPFDSYPGASPDPYSAAPPDPYSATPSDPYSAASFDPLGDPSGLPFAARESSPGRRRRGAEPGETAAHPEPFGNRRSRHAAADHAEEPRSARRRRSAGGHRGDGPVDYPSFDSGADQFQYRSDSVEDRADQYHYTYDHLEDVTGSYAPYEPLDDLPAPVGDPLTGPIPGLTFTETDDPHSLRPADDSEPDWYAPVRPPRDNRAARGSSPAARHPSESYGAAQSHGTTQSQGWETQPHDWSEDTGWDLAGQPGRRGSAETTTSATAVPGVGHRSDVPNQARRRPEYDEYPADLRPRRSNPGALAGAAYDTKRPTGPAGTDSLDGHRPSDDWTTGESPRSSRNGRSAHSARAARPARTGRGSRRTQRGRFTGLSAPLAVAVALVGALGSAFLDLLATGGLSVLFSLGFVMTSFGVAATIRRTDVFTAGVLPPLAALGTFVAVGVMAPDRLGNADNVSPVIAVLAGLASESWTLVAASALALGTVALRVGLGYRELNEDEPTEDPAEARAGGRRSGSRPRF